MKSHVGLIGHGNMGQFVAQHLRPFFVLHIFDPKKQADDITEKAHLEEAAAQPIVVLAVPVQQLEQVLKKIAPSLAPGALVIDLCSVKTIPMQFMKSLLPKTVEYIGTHPVFGPESGKDGIVGLPIAICSGRSKPETLRKLIGFCSKRLGLKVIECSPREHDLEMAYGLALTHLISRSFQAMDIPKLSMPTKSYELMLAIKNNLSNDSKELFITIQNYNPYAQKIRQSFVAEIEKLESLLEENQE